ncbi:MAG: SUMF1/EgtB/PvdO family nonheme iron enzyme, partial [Patescibacteria group bacterium]|nr:SUMF1/EgtB/PvdO family nonheme iron enzyme [Patescibacteria group bacterium]
MNAYRVGPLALGIVLLAQLLLFADVFSMGPGLASLDFVTVRNGGNAADTTGFGGVPYDYQMGTYSVTAAQYTAFLNAVAATDTYGLYHANMWSQAQGCKIQRAGASDAYTYSVAADYANRPVNFVSWGSAARFMNWLHNEQAVGSGVDAAWITETGAYNLNGATSFAALMGVTRNADATYWIPSENEWYKAAYHKNNGLTADYWIYPTGSNTVPSNLLDPLGDNNATFRTGTDPNYVYTVGSPYWRTEVGAHAKSASPYGTFDQGGNTYDWT